jgi:hypothetical protein
MRTLLSCGELAAWFTVTGELAYAGTRGEVASKISWFL